LRPALPIEFHALWGFKLALQAFHYFLHEDLEEVLLRKCGQFLSLLHPPISTAFFIDFYGLVQVYELRD